MSASKTIRSKLLEENERRRPRKFAVEIFIATNPELKDQVMAYAQEWLSLQSEGTPVSISVLANLLKTELGLPESVGDHAVRSWLKWRF